MTLPSFRLCLGLAAAVLSSSAALAQGSLTPPGAPGPTMMRLDQITGRIPLVHGLHGTSIDPTSNTITISQPGSYYLTGHVQVQPGGSSDGIIIAANFVTLDLNGYTIGSSVTPATGNAISLQGNRSQITIRNGQIRSGYHYRLDSGGVPQPPIEGPGFIYGIRTTGQTSESNRALVVEDLTASGLQSFFSVYGSSGILRRCTLNSCGGGIDGALVAEDCYMTSMSGSGISNTQLVKNCYVESSGFSAIHGTRIVDSIGITRGDNATAISALGSATGCSGFATGNGSIGIYAGNASNCEGYASGNKGAPDGYNGPEGEAIGISVFGSAENCTSRAPLGIGLRARIAVACTISEGTALIQHKYNMP